MQLFLCQICIVVLVLHELAVFFRVVVSEGGKLHETKSAARRLCVTTTGVSVWRVSAFGESHIIPVKYFYMRALTWLVHVPKLGYLVSFGVENYIALQR